MGSTLIRDINLKKEISFFEENSMTQILGAEICLDCVQQRPPSQPDHEEQQQQQHGPSRPQQNGAVLQPHVHQTEHCVQ